MSGARLGVVVNPTAANGRGAARGVEVVAGLRARGHEVLDLTGADLHVATRQARQAAVDGLDALVVVGGDGMVHLGANVVAQTGLPLGIVAAGSGNDIARALDLPRHDVPAALGVLERALDGGGREIDAVHVGAVDGEDQRWFLGVLSAGFDAAVNAHANTLRRPSGTLRYIRALVERLRTFTPYGYRITLDDGVWESAGTLVAVANVPSFGGGMRIAPEARLDDGLLDVVLAGPLSRTGLLRVFPRVYSGTHLEHAACQVLRSRRVVIEPGPGGPHPPETFADGERLGPLPLVVEARPRAVRVLAGA